MGPSHTNPGGGQEDSHQGQADVPPSGGTIRDVAGQGLDHQVPRPAAGDTPEEDRGVATPSQHEERQAVRTALSIDIQRALDGAGCFHEASYPTPDTVGHHDPAHDRNEQGQRQGKTTSPLQQTEQVTPALQAELTALVGRLQLLNDNNWCYANSSFYGLIWTLLCQVSLQPYQRGTQFDDLIEFVRSGVQSPMHLMSTQWFQQILRHWGQPAEQQDCAECTFRLLQWLQPDMVDMRWERRLDTSAGIETLDTGSCYKPIRHVINHDMHQRGSGTFAQLIADWHQELSMHQALLHSPTAICLQIDRWYQNEQGDISKSTCKLEMDREIDLPVFRAADLKCDKQSYMPVAGISHLGLDRAGHCKAMLRTQPALTVDGSPATWLITDDEKQPEPAWRIPDELLCNLVVIWLVRSDCLHLPVFSPDRL